MNARSFFNMLRNFFYFKLIIWSYDIEFLKSTHSYYLKYSWSSSASHYCPTGSHASRVSAKLLKRGGGLMIFFLIKKNYLKCIYSTYFYIIMDRDKVFHTINLILWIVRKVFFSRRALVTLTTLKASKWWVQSCLHWDIF